jgi:hypothetical protein
MFSLLTTLRSLTMSPIDRALRTARNMARLKLEAGGAVTEQRPVSIRLTDDAWYAAMRAKRNAAEWALLVETDPEKKRRLRARRDRCDAILTVGPDSG